MPRAATRAVAGVLGGTAIVRVMGMAHFGFLAVRGKLGQAFLPQPDPVPVPRKE